MLLTIERIHI